MTLFWARNVSDAVGGLAFGAPQAAEHERPAQVAVLEADEHLVVDLRHEHQPGVATRRPA